MAHRDKEVGPTTEPDWRPLYEQTLKRAEDAEARADELKRAEAAARGEARLYKSLFEAARGKRQEADEETRRVRHVAKGALFLQSEVARLTRLLREAGVDPRRRRTIMSLRMEVEGLRKAVPGAEVQAADGGRVQRVDRVRQIQSQVLVGVELAGLRNQCLRKLRVDAPVSTLAGIGQGGAFDGRANAHVVQLGRLRRETGFDIAQAFPVGQLRKCQRAKVLGTREGANMIVAAVAFDYSRKGRPWKKIHQLSEQGFASVHGVVSGNAFPEGRLKSHPRSSRHHSNLQKRFYYSSRYRRRAYNGVS